MASCAPHMVSLHGDQPNLWSKLRYILFGQNPIKHPWQCSINIIWYVKEYAHLFIYICVCVRMNDLNINPYTLKLSGMQRSYALAIIGTCKWPSRQPHEHGRGYVREIDGTLSQVACQQASIYTPWFSQTTPMLGMFPVAYVCFRNPNHVIIWATRRIKIIMKWVNPLNTLSNFILILCSLFIVDHMKPSSKSFSSYFVWVSKSVTFQDNKLTLSTTKSHHNVYPHCTISKYLMYERPKSGSKRN